MSEVNRVAIDKVCWKAKINYWYYISTINLWGNLHTWQIKNEKKITENSLQSHVIFNYLSESK